MHLHGIFSKNSTGVPVSGQVPWAKGVTFPVDASDSGKKDWICSI